MDRMEQQATPVKIIGVSQVRSLQRMAEEGQRETHAKEEKIVLNLEGFDSLDCGGLRALLRFSRQIRSRGGEVALASLSKNIRSQVQKMRLHHVLDIYNTPEEALRGCSV